MKIKFVVVGKTVEKYLIQGCEEYLKRIKKYVNFEYVVLKDLSSLLQDKSYKILLDENGKEFTSKEFSIFLEKKMVNLSKDITFVVGGPYGFDDDIKAISDFEISLSKMTFSHQMVRLIFLEQLYRAFTIMRGEPYHHQ